MRIMGARTFTLGAPLYDWMTAQEVWRGHVRSLLQHFPPVPEGETRREVLDLGTGPGVSAITLAEADSSLRVTGVDYSEGMLARARPRVAASSARDRIHLQHADARALPFPDHSFNVATGHSFLYLVPEREKVLAEVRRVLRPGGRLLLLEPRRGGRLALGEAIKKDPRFALSMTLWRMASGVEGRFSEEELALLLENHGFSVRVMQESLGGLGMVAVAGVAG